MYIIVVPNGEHDFFVESVDASDRSIETSQELEMALKFESEADAKGYMSWSSTRYRIEPIEKYQN